MTRRDRIYGELRETAKLAGPVVAGQIGIMAMNVVDTAMVKSLGADAVGAVGVGGAAYSVAFLFGVGVLFSLDRVVAFAWGARDRARCRDAMVQGLWLSTLLSVPLVAILFAVAGQLESVGVDPEVAPLAAEYLKLVAWSVWPSLLFTAIRQTLQATGDVAAANLILVGCNVVNALANQAFIHGSFGMPALGVAGAGWATLISRTTMLVAIAWWAWHRGISPETKARLTPDPRLLKDLLKLGFPAGLQMLAEAGLFSLTTFLAAGIGATEAAAHHIVLQVASVTFMVPMGIGAAGAVRVGQAHGAGNEAGARRAGWAAVGLGAGFMVFSAITLLGTWRHVLSPFASDENVLNLARQLLVCAALFQVFDGAQVSLSGVLRGAGDTVRPLFANLIGHWIVGMPVAVGLCFYTPLGLVGLWLGLAAGLASTAVGLLVAWVRTSRGLVVAPG